HVTGAYEERLSMAVRMFDHDRVLTWRVFGVEALLRTLTVLLELDRLFVGLRNNVYGAQRLTPLLHDGGEGVICGTEARERRAPSDRGDCLCAQGSSLHELRGERRVTVPTLELGHACVPHG